MEAYMKLLFTFLIVLSGILCPQGGEEDPTYPDNKQSKFKMLLTELLLLR